MKPRLFAVLVVSLTLAADAPKDKKSASLEGTWQAAVVEYNGEGVLEDVVKKLKVTITADQFAVDGEATELERYSRFTYRADPKASPATIDLTFARGDDKGNKLLGIYQRKGDELHFCFHLSGKERPTEFKSEGGSNVARAVFKHVAP